MSSIIRLLGSGWRLGLCMLIWLLILPYSTPIIAQSPPLVVTYLDGDSLFVWQPRTEPRILAKGGFLAHPLIAPDASRVIFLRDDVLWIASLNPTEKPATMLVKPETLDSDLSRRVLEMVWLDTRTVIFNTYRYMPKLLVQQQIADDLWQVDVETDSVSRLREDRQGGAFSISPDGQHIALVRPGDYASNQPGSIDVVDKQAKTPVRLLDYPFVTTGASTQFYPQVEWASDSQALYVAIPDPNLVYKTENVPPTVLWQLSVTGQAVRLGGVQADFFGLPRFSVDGKFILYARRIGTPKENQLALLRANSDGSGEREIVRDTIGELEPAQWILNTDNYTFVHGNPGEVWIAANDQHRLTSNLVFTLQWADPQIYIYQTSIGSVGEVRYSANNVSQKIVACTACGDFDVHHAP
ncbi:MAG: hypothetical protein ABI947_07590 [Chloroflexota bacterium]